MRRRYRRLLAASLSLALLALVLELGLRWLLFGESRVALRMGKGLRVPDAFFAVEETDHWKLAHLFVPAKEHRPRHAPDPLLGWARRPLDPAAVERELSGRRLVLLVGDSYAECVTPAEECFEGLLARSDLADEYVLVNRGTGGYGFDQIRLALDPLLDALGHLDPIVVVSVFVDNDFDRTVLSFRERPKPRFRLADGELVLERPDPPDPDEWIARHPVAVTSYAWRLGEHLLGLDRAGRERRVAALRDEQRDLAAALLADAHADLVRRDVEHFFLLFLGRWALSRPAPADWQEGLCHEVLGRIGAPFVSSRWPLLLGARPWEEYFGTEDTGHYGPLGNEVVFQCLRDGLEGRFESPEFVARAVRGVRVVLRARAEGELAVARFGVGRQAPFDAPEDDTHILLRPGERGASAGLALEGRFARFSGVLKAVPQPAKPGCRTLRLAVSADGRELLAAPLGHGEEPLAIDLDVGGVHELVLSVTADGPVQPCDAAFLASPALLE